MELSSYLPQPLPRILDPDQITAITAQNIKAFLQLVEELSNSITYSSASFVNTIQRLADLENAQSGDEAVIAALQYTGSDDATQAAIQAASEAWSRARGDEKVQATLYLLLNAVKLKNEPLEPEDRRLLNRTLSDLLQQGAAISDADERATWQASQQEIDSLCANFNRNLREGDCVLQADDTQLDGLPVADIEQFPRTSSGLREIHLRTKHDVTRLLSCVKDASVRRRIEAEYSGKLSENVAIFGRILFLRDKNARLLGYSTHAESKLSIRLPEAMSSVYDLLKILGDKLSPLGYQYIRDLKQQKRKDLSGPGAPGSPDIDEADLHSWDVLYYRRMLHEEIGIDQEKFAEYFPLSKVVSNMLRFFARNLRLRVTKVDDSLLDGARWSTDVEVWSVWNQDDGEHEPFVGYLYLDLLDRPGKYKHNQAVNLQPGYLRQDGTRVYPASTLMCAFPRPTAWDIPLLKHSHLVSLFHEFGRCLHDLLARTRYSRNHGYRVCLEFGEAIGTMFESCCWNPDILKQISCHYMALDDEESQDDRPLDAGRSRTPREIPDSLLVGLTKQRSYFRLQRYLPQLLVATWDAMIHGPPLNDFDEQQLYARLHEKFLGYSLPDPSFQYVQFNHLTSGYDAGYYAYVYASCIAEDFLLSSFPKGLDDQEFWDRFRSGILVFGGSRDELTLLTEHLGRRPTPDALIFSLEGLNT